MLAKLQTVSSEKSLKEIIDKIFEAIIVVDRDFKLLFANEVIKDVTGKPPEDLIGLPLDITLFAEDAATQQTVKQPLTLSTIVGLAKSGESLEFVVLLANSVKVSMECRASSIFWENQAAYLVVLHDITNVKHIAQLTAEINEKSRLDKLKDEFISIVSHEMRTPLTIIKSAVSNLKDGIIGAMTDKQIKVLETTNRNVDRLSRIINDLLDLSRLESGKAKINRRKLGLAHLIEEVVHNLQSVAAKKNLTIGVDLPHDLPPVFIDADLIYQVLTNLVQNALRYAKKKITLEVRLEKSTLAPGSKSAENTIRVGVIDDGDGISNDKLGVLFSKFAQINRPSGGSGYKGTGLGLAICKQIVVLHHGRIWAEGGAGQGARFYFSLPVYHENNDFLVALENVVHQTERNKTSLAVLIIALSNMPRITDECSERDIAWMFTDLTNEIHNKALRKSDFLHFKRDTKDFIIIFPDTDKAVAQKIAQRIHNLTKDCFCPGKSGKVFVTLNTGIASYPEDAANAHDLLDKAFKEIH